MANKKEEVKVISLDTIANVGEKITLANREYVVVPINVADMHIVAKNSLLLPLQVKGEEIDNHLVDPESFRGWIRVALQESKVMHRELVFKYRNFPEVLEMHKIFMNSLYNLAKEYNTDNYITCIMYFDKLWELLSYKLN